MDEVYRDEKLLLAARLYYIDGLVQSEVARLVNVSQAKVSRLLALARERGIVRISVPEYEPRHPALERRLRRETGLKHVVVIKAEPGAVAADLRRTVAYFAAATVADLLQPGGVLAVAGGRTLQELIAHLEAPEERGALTVVQAMGNIDSRVGPHDAVEIGHAMAQRWGGTFHVLNTPAFLPDRQTRDRFVKLDAVRPVKGQLRRADMALVGVGTPWNSVFVERGVLTEADVRLLVRRGAVGEICGRFFDIEGRECDTPFRHRVVGIDLDDLRRIGKSLAVVAGSDRGTAIRAAVRGGLIKGLVIDQYGAEAVLNAANS